MRHWFGLTVCIVGGLLAAGCGGGGTSSLLDKPEVMFFNASPDIAGLDFYLDDTLLAANVAFEAGSDFVITDPQDRDIGIFEANTTNNFDLIFDTFERNKHYLVSSIGLADFGNDFKKRVRVVLTEVDRHIVQGTKSRLIILHAYCREEGFETPAIDFQSPGNNPQYKASNIEFAETSTLLIDAGVRSFDARRTGTEEVYASLTNFTFGAGKIYLVYVTGVENGVGNAAPQVIVKEIPSKDYP